MLFAMGIYDKHPLWVDVRWQWLKVRQLLRRIARAIARAIFVVLLVSAPSLVGLHWFNHIPIDDSIRLLPGDYRVIFQCWNHPLAIARYLDQGPYKPLIEKPVHECSLNLKTFDIQN